MSGPPIGFRRESRETASQLKVAALQRVAMTHFFEKRDRWGNGMALWIIVTMAFLIPVAIWGIRKTRMENEVQDWISSDNLQAQAFQWTKDHFPTEDPVLVTWDRSNLNDSRMAALAARIRGVAGSDGTRRDGIRQIARVRTPQELITRMVQHDVPREEAVRRLQGVLVGVGPLRIRLTELGRAHSDTVSDLLRKAARDELGLTLQITDPTDLAPSITAASVDVENEEGVIEQVPPFAIYAEHDLQVRWPGLEPNREETAKLRALATGLRLRQGPADKQDQPLVADTFFVPGTPVAMALYLSEAGTADRPTSFQLLRTAAESVGIPPEALHLAGGGVTGTALNAEVLRAFWDPTAPLSSPVQRSVVVVSWLVGVGLAVWLLGSLRLAMLVLAVSYFTVLVATSLVPLTGGTMNMVLVVMPTLLLVTTLSGGIHLANYWKHAAARNPQTAVVAAVNTARTPCIWASLTTAIGLASLTTSTLMPVRMFGLYSAIGTLISLAAVLYGLPALLQLLPSRAPRAEELDHQNWHQFGGWVARHYRGLIVTSLLVCGVSTYGLVHLKTETKVIRYFPEQARIVQDYDFVEQNITGAVPVDILVRFDTDAQGDTRFLERLELVRKIGETLRQDPEISGALSLADFLPEAEAPAADANIRVRAKYAAKSRTIEARVKSNTDIGTQSLITTISKPSNFNSAGDEVWRITAQVAMLSQLKYDSFMQHIDDICQEVLKRVAAEAGEKYRKPGVDVAYHPGASHLVTGMVPVFLATQNELLISLTNSFLLAFVTIAIVMMVLLGHPVAGLLAMVPNVLPIGAVFGLIAWSGMSIDIGTIVTASVALGIAVDGTLHIVTWFRLGIAEGKSRETAVVDALAHCGPAMWQTSFVVGLGLLMLAPADLILISRFGWLMAALICGAMISDLVLTPSLLAGPLGIILQRCLPKTEASEEIPAEPVAVAAPEHPAVQAPHVAPQPGHRKTARPRISRID